MAEEYKVRSGFKCNPWAIKKLSGLQLCAFICPSRADLSAATVLPSHFWLLIQMYSPSFAFGVGAPNNTVVHVYSLVFSWTWTSHCSHPVALVCWLLQIATHPTMLLVDECQGWGIEQLLGGWRRSKGSAFSVFRALFFHLWKLWKSGCHFFFITAQSIIFKFLLFTNQNPEALHLVLSLNILGLT